MRVGVEVGDEGSVKGEGEVGDEGRCGGGGGR